MPVPRSSAPVMLPAVIVTVSLPVPLVTEPIAPAPLLKVRVLVPLPRSRLPLNEPLLFTVAVSLPLPRAMLSMPEKVTLPRLPLPAPLIVRLLAVLSLLATLSESVPLPPSRLIVELEALLTVKASSPARPLTVSKPEKVVAVPLLTELVPLPVPVTVMV